MKKILVVAATTFEIQPFLDFLKKALSEYKNPLFGMSGYDIDVLISGVGTTHTALKMGKSLALKQYDFAVNAGIAGVFSQKILRGAVVEVVGERFGDLGVEEDNGAFTDLIELGLLLDDGKIFSKKGKLLNPNPLKIKDLPTVQGLTVQTVHGTKASIAAALKKYPDSDIETMEGAAFFQACLSEDVPFVALRGISNFVEPRNRDNWLMSEAIDNLNRILISLFENRLI